MDAKDSELDRRRRLDLLNAAAVLMDYCGLSVAQAMAVRVQLSPEQIARLKVAGQQPISAVGKLQAHRVLEEMRQAAAVRVVPKRRRRK